jgi:2-polyprenyl-3-methyl-5-hydroxy-6-metoxy-1,4-benzoquinol methylase
MEWKKFYKKHCGVSGRELITGIRDWEQRSKIFLNWIKNSPKNIKILDCGCGIGIAGLILKENGFRNVIGVDINRKNVETASRLFRAYQMDCNKLELKEKFDVIIVLNLIEHLNFPQKFLKKVKRILRPNGMLILSLPNEMWFRKLLGIVPKDPTHKQSWSYLSFKKFLVLNGFKILDIKPIGRTPFLLTCQTFMVLAKKR